MPQSSTIPGPALDAYIQGYEAYVHGQPPLHPELTGPLAESWRDGYELARELERFEL